MLDMNDIRKQVRILQRYAQCKCCGITYERKHKRDDCCSKVCKLAMQERLSPSKEHELLALMGDLEASLHAERNPVHEQEVTFKRPDRIEYGHYVYGWYESKDSALPFYIGLGQGGRAWYKHKGQFCERFRNHKTYVKIYVKRLTEHEATVIEAFLIRLFRQLGAQLTNCTHFTGFRQFCERFD